LRWVGPILVCIGSFSMTWGLLRVLRKRRRIHEWQRDQLWKQIKRARAIDDAIDRWHAGDGKGVPLHVYLGLTPEQYEKWLRDPDSMEEVLHGK
jgi:hypothetical protein